MRRLRMGLVASVLGALVVTSLHAADDATRTRMQRVFGALTTLLPAALSGSLDDAAARENGIVEAAEDLASATADLESHVPPGDSAFGFLSASLADDARAIRLRVSSGRYNDAAYRIVRMTQTCVACHARLPSEEGPSFATALLDRIDTSVLPAEQVARLEIATRQFDRGLERYERLFADPEQPAAALDYTGALADYLAVVIRVRANPARAKRALETLRRRDDLTGQLRRVLPIWITALEDLGSEISGLPDSDPAIGLDRAGAILAQGAELRQRPSDRADLIHRIVASALLYRYIERDAGTVADRAEALLLLGESDAFVRRSFERSEAEFYFARAIRLAPGTEVAREAYARLEDAVLFGYTGSGGLQLPPDVRRALEVLRKLAEGEPDPEPDSGAGSEPDSRPGADL